jgi:hypothetical protein
LSWGDWLAAASGILMIISLFLPWYTANGEDATAWQAMALDDVILFIAGVLAVTATVVVGMRNVSSLSVAATSLAIMPAGVGFVLVVYRLLSPAPPVDVSLDIGAWLALTAAFGLAVGAWRGATDEGPARRNAAAERRGTDAGLARSELLDLNAPLQK